MGRPRQDVRRDQQLNLSLTSEEAALLRQRARNAGLRLPVYCRFQLLQYRAVITETIAARFDPKFVHQLMRVGNNLNQIARALNAHPDRAVPDDLGSTLRELRLLLREAAHDPAHT